jgi:septum formation protein
MKHPLEKLKKYDIILASKSPRRKQLLESLDIDFDVQIRTVDEIFPDDIAVENIAEYLAKLKASAFPTQFIPNNQLIITADTVVIADNQILEKPKDAQEAKEMILKLSEKSHLVVSAVCIKTNNYEKCFSVSTEVEFCKLSLEEIQYYIENYKPFDKAGAYGIQEWIGNIGIKEIKGSFYNVMGLPTHKLYDELKKFCDEQKA